MTQYHYPKSTLDKLYGWGLTLKYDDDGRLDLSGIEFPVMSFDGLQLPGVILDDCRLSGASFQGTNLTNASFVGADLRDTDLTGAIGLTGAQLAQAVNLEFCNGIEHLFDDIERAGYHWLSEEEIEAQEGGPL